MFSHVNPKKRPLVNLDTRALVKYQVQFWLWLSRDFLLPFQKKVFLLSLSEALEFANALEQNPSKCLLYLFILWIRSQIICHSLFILDGQDSDFFLSLVYCDLLFILFVYSPFSFLSPQKKRTMFYQLFGQIVIKQRNLWVTSSCKNESHSLLTFLLIISQDRKKVKWGLLLSALL